MRFKKAYLVAILLIAALISGPIAMNAGNASEVPPCHQQDKQDAPAKPFCPMTCCMIVIPQSVPVFVPAMHGDVPHASASVFKAQVPAPLLAPPRS